MPEVIDTVAVGLSIISVVLAVVAFRQSRLTRRAWTKAHDWMEQAEKALQVIQRDIDDRKRKTRTMRD